MIRKAETQESEILTRLSFTSKGHWNYPKELFAVWSDELTVSADYIEKNDVFVLVSDERIVAYYSVVELKDDIEISGIIVGKGFWLEHMFVEPQSIGKGIGTKMFEHLRKRCAFRGICNLGILADPNSRGFYEKMGCTYVREYPSTIKNRTTPYLRLRGLGDRGQSEP